MSIKPAFRPGRLLLLALFPVALVWAYDLSRNAGGKPVTWNAGSVTMRIQLGSAAVLSDGNNYSTSVQAAMQTWNSVLGTVQFASQVAVAAVPIDNNDINEIGFDGTVYGEAFDANVLAVTVSYYSVPPRADGTSQRVESDIIFNYAYTWDSYRGSWRGTPKDLQRVVLHELGHVLGLRHPDEANPPQSVTAMMNSHVSDLDTLAGDDIAGAQFLYGMPSSAPGITGQPANQSVYAGQTAQFSVSASGNPAPTYRWQRLPSGSATWADLSDGGNYSGTGTAILSVASTTTVMTGDQFRCVATNANGNATSSAATLTVLAPTGPSISSQPSSQTVTEGSSVTFTAAASGVPAPTLQWQKGGVNIGGATGSSYTIASVAVGDAGSYTLVATNPAGTATSNAAILTVNAPPLITSLSPPRQVVNVGQSINLSVTASSSGIISYQWAHNGHAVSGATSNTFTKTNITAADSGYYYVNVTDSNGTRRSAAIFVIVPPAATVSHIVAWGNNSFGQINVPAGLTDAVAVAAGNNASLALRADGTVIAWGENSYDRTSIPAGLANVVAVAAGTWHSLAMKADGTVVSWGASSYGLATTAAGLTDVVAVSAGSYYSLALKSDGTVIAWGETSYHETEVPAGLNNVVAIAGANVTSLALKANGTVVAWGFNGHGEANVPVGLANVVAIATGAGHSLALKADGTVVAWGDNSLGQTNVPGGLANVVAIAADSVSFALKADGTIVTWGSDGSNPFTFPQIKVPLGLTGVQAVAVGWQHALALSPGPVVAPSIILQPASQTINSGSAVSFTVAVDGSAPFLYKWQRLLAAGGSWSDFGSGVAGPILTIAPSTLAMNGDQFRCIVSNTAGSATSAAATLTVVPGSGAPVVTMQPSSSTVLTGAVASFSIAASGTATLLYQWQSAYVGSSMWGDIGNLEIFTPGRHSPPTYSGINGPTLLINTSPVFNNIQFRCVITNGEGSAISNAAILTLLPNPEITTQPLSQTVKAGSSVTVTVVASGTPAPTYQWKKNGVNINGATGSSYTIASVASGDGGTYTVVAANSVSSATSNPATLTVLTFGKGDLNGDSMTDILWENTGTGEHGLWAMNGTVPATWINLPSIALDWRIVGTGDFNGDGMTDILWENVGSGDRGLWIMNGTVPAAWINLPSIALDWRIVGTGDFNGDDMTDILWENVGSGDRGLWIMNGTVPAAWINLPSIALDWRIVGTGDFNGDGMTDILWENVGSGDRGLWIMNGTVPAAWINLPSIALDWRIVGTGDYDGDGQTDILWENIGSGDRGLWLMNGTVPLFWINLPTLTLDWRIAQ